MIGAYWSERLPARRMGPLVLLLTAAARAGRSTMTGVVGDAILAFLLSAQFRVWDDLADRGHDAIAHPDRVLVRASAWPVVGLCVLLGIAATVGVARRPVTAIPLTALILLNLAVALCYRARGSRSLTTDHLLLARYAGFVFVIAISAGQVRAWPLTLSMAAVFLAMSIYEGLHDRTSPLARRPMVLAGESCLLVGTLAVLGGQL